MSRKCDLFDQLAGRDHLLASDVVAEIQTILTPKLSPQRTDLQSIVAAVRAGRQAIEALFASTLISARLANVLEPAGVSREQIERALNKPFPPNTSITREFLDTQNARIQQLELCVGLLMAVVVELQYPSDRPTAYVSATSAERRRA